MKEYTKIQNIYKRDPKTNYRTLMRFIVFPYLYLDLYDTPHIYGHPWLFEQGDGNDYSYGFRNNPGDGRGYGYGYSNGEGFGSGYTRWDGDGDGYGEGYCNGDGYGNGWGDCYGDVFDECYKY